MTEAVFISRGPADLPLEVTSFVGRRSDLRRIREVMSESRLVTLTGFGGIGKTRLALRMATELRRVFDGVYVVPFGGVADSEAVPEQLAAALGLQGRSRGSATITVVEYLRPRSVLLVLDNCEHVVDVVAVLADTLLRTCPKVHILATSRESLRTDGEVEYPVMPLTIPEQVSGEEPLHQFEAVQLFLDRARAIVPGFDLNDENRAAIAAISRKLEGIPLAIELAAARLRTFSPAELDARLSDRWELLSRGSRTAPYRHSTMAACVEWSFDLCTPAEKLLWAKVAVFRDGFELDAAVAVCSERDDDEPIEETLASLVEKSVLTSIQHQGVNRYRMLPPIRYRGRVELGRIGRDAELRRRHKDFYLDLVARAHEDWFGPRQVDTLSRLRRDLGNLRKALELCAVEPDSADQGLMAGANLLEWGLVEGRFGMGRQWFERILSGRPGDPGTRALALRTASLWAAMQGDVKSAVSLLEEGQVLATRLGGETETLLVQAAGFVAMFAGDPARAEELLSEAARGFAAFGNNAELAFCFVLLALERNLLGDLDGALESNRACLALAEPVGEIWLRSWSLWVAGQALWARGDPGAARELVMQSLRLKRLIAEPMGIAVVLETLAWIAAATDPARAATLLGAAQNEWDKIETSARVLPWLDKPHREAMDAARTRLGDAAFDSAWSDGRVLDQATAIALGLEEPTPAAKSTTGSRARASHSGLTRRERQIAELVHKGLSDKQIADTLVISPRTAETHVQHILTKLGFKSRTQVAAWIGEQRRADDH
ncbi:LuxR family transcriptional regulator [Nocardioides gansuensis]|uniref:LuxR family transcriptional regulator n=1 Tax=Nocardioides gansuensis TaxID=2138300 RepID=A0A2T8F4J0_9ACTN|nr:LuxR C-terminal-related transcriptional regulator [Nocardioides gansuensis]PVG80633.1 LuxR family transcriptional regulator [Nocardioides gansuensis]